MTSPERTLFVIGSGPGIGRSVTTLFASKRYTKVALFARRQEQLEKDQAAIEKAVGSNIKIKTFALDVVNTDELLKALGEAEAELGKAECIFYNAARVLPSELLKHDVKEIEYDFKINVSALYTVTQRQLPQLIALAKTDTSAIPSIIITTSMLPMDPVPQVFALGVVKAAQRNLAQVLHMTYESEGVHIGMINVGGPVTDEHEAWNPPNIAEKAWEWFSQLKEKPSFEVII